MTRLNLVGVWRLQRFEIRKASGQSVLPFGEHCDGMLVLTEDGVLSAQLMRVDRTSFSQSDIFGGTSEEIVAAYRGFLSFWGNYEVNEGERRLTYTVQGSLFPNWVGQKNLRHIDLAGDQLTLSTDPQLAGGEEVVGILQWQRADLASKAQD